MLSTLLLLLPLLLNERSAWKYEWTNKPNTSANKRVSVYVSITCLYSRVQFLYMMFKRLFYSNDAAADRYHSQENVFGKDKNYGV